LGSAAHSSSWGPLIWLKATQRTASSGSAGSSSFWWRGLPASVSSSSNSCRTRVWREPGWRKLGECEEAAA
jgi:hypothetical protein